MAKQHPQPPPLIPPEVAARVAHASNPTTSSGRLENIALTTTSPAIEAELSSDAPPPEPLEARFARMEALLRAQADENRTLRASLASKDAAIRVARSRAPYLKTVYGYRTGSLDPTPDLLLVREEHGKHFVRINAWIPVSGSVEVRASKPFTGDSGESLCYTNLNIGSLNIDASPSTITLPLFGSKEVTVCLKAFATIGIVCDGPLPVNAKPTPLAPDAVLRLLSGEDTNMDDATGTDIQGDTTSDSTLPTILLERLSRPTPPPPPYGSRPSTPFG